jgi:hypothetical protein
VKVFPPDTFSRETSPLDPWYVTGFVEREGAFTFSRNGRQMALYFAIKLPAVDRPILEAIQAHFGGSGAIYQVAPRAAPTPSSGHTKAASYYRVTRQRDLEQVLDHFDRYPLQGTKAASYAIWREMVILKRAFRNPPREELDDLASRLSAASPRKGPGT